MKTTKQSILKSHSKYVYLMLFFLSFTFYPNYCPAQDYSKVKGIYQTYLDGDPVVVENLNLYYVLNKNGIALMAFGSSPSRAFYDVAGGLKSGRIKSGNFTMTANDITIKLEGGSVTEWIYVSQTRTLKRDNMKLIYVEGL